MQRTKRKQHNERSGRDDCFRRCVLTVASAAFVLCYRVFTRWSKHQANIKQKHEANVKQTWGKLTAHVVHVYFQYICFMFASSCKHVITSRGLRGLRLMETRLSRRI